MTDWNAGYVTEIDYTFGYFPELNPLRVKLAFLNARLLPPKVGVACELGFGQGMSVNLHAAASVVKWQGTDFQPSQAGFAQELAHTAQSDCHLYDEAFAEFCIRPDLPDFDYIGLHGIWSWISDENRQTIVEFIRRKLKVGGVLYISYNTQPGWAAMAPIRDLLAEYAEVFGSNGTGIFKRIDGALDFVDRLLDANPTFMRANPQVAERIKQIKEQDHHYIAHEYFNGNWQPMSFAQIKRWLTTAKLNWACSANYLDAVDAVNLSAEQQALLANIPDPIFRQTTRDFCVNQQFRKDFWVKGKRTLTPLEQAEALRQVKVLLVQHRSDVNLKVNAGLGEVTMQGAVYTVLLDLLADHKIKSLAQLEQDTKLNEIGKSITFTQLLQAVMILIATGTLVPVQDEEDIVKAKKSSDRLNQLLIDKSRSNKDIGYLASPVMGGGFMVPRIHQLFMLALQQGKKKPEECAQFVWQILSIQGQKLLKAGKSLETSEENLSELRALAQIFVEKQLPILKVLQIA